MTDRINAITVVLEQDIRDDDAQHIVAAIQMIKGVLSAATLVASITDQIAHERARRELGEKLIDVIYPQRKVQP